MRSSFAPFVDRRAAGRQLAALLAPARASGALVLAVPRGGAVVGWEIARTLGAPFEVMVTRRLHSPRDPGLVLGAVAETGAVWVDTLRMGHAGVRLEELSDPIVAESLEVERRARAYREGRSRYAIDDRTVVLVDDGIVSGATARAAIIATRALAPRKLVLAVPVAEAEVVEQLRALVDAVVTVWQPPELGALDHWYTNFAPVTEGEVFAIFAEARARSEAALDAAVP